MFWYPHAKHDPQPTNGGTMTGGTNRATIHTLEGGNISLGAPYYHIGFKDHGDRVEVVQWRGFNVAAKSLKNGPDPVQTNRQGTHHPQACIIGYAKDSPNLSARMVEALADFAIWCELELGVPATSDRVWFGTDGFGTGAPSRMSVAKWATFSGWCGHQHVPDSNTHWDPGKLPWAKIQAVIDEKKGTMAFTEHEETQLKRIVAAIDAEASDGSGYKWVIRLVRAFAGVTVESLEESDDIEAAVAALEAKIAAIPATPLDVVADALEEAANEIRNG